MAAKRVKKRAKKGKSGTGPEAARLKPEGDWKQNIKEALAKKRPEEGWPKQKTVATGAPHQMLRRPRARSR